MTITSETPVRQIAIEAPGTIPVLEKFGIDYCCGGGHSLAEACTARDLQPESILSELTRQQEKPNIPATRWQDAPLAVLTEYIVTKHHAFTRTQLDLTGRLAAKVEQRHASAHPETIELNKILAGMKAELLHHFFCEENILFPYLVRLESQEPPPPPPAFGSIEKPIMRMMTEHDQAGEALRRMREITDNYLPPADACTTYRALYGALQELERDLHQHVHLENNILFPRALKLANA